MQVRVLGCSGSIARGCRTTSFLIDGKILIDAGTGVGDLSLEEMAKIDHVFLTHSHLDHIAALPLMLDAVSGMRKQPLQVHALPETIHALREHIFNGVIWPDFAKLPNSTDPFLRYETISQGQVVEAGGTTVEVLPAIHTVPAVGYAVQACSGLLVYSGDTGPNPALWRRLNELPVSVLIIETAFSNQEIDLATRALHLVPDLLVRELAQWKPIQPCSVYISHIKPAEVDLICEEIHFLTKNWQGETSDKPSIRSLITGDEINV